jgi:hypothetical protein
MCILILLVLASRAVNLVHTARITTIAATLQYVCVTRCILLLLCACMRRAGAQLKNVS